APRRMELGGLLAADERRVEGPGGGVRIELAGTMPCCGGGELSVSGSFDLAQGKPFGFVDNSLRESSTAFRMTIRKNGFSRPNICQPRALRRCGCIAGLA